MESRFDEKYVYTVKSTTKVTECLAQNIRKQIDCKRPSSTKVRNVRIEI